MGEACYWCLRTHEISWQPIWDGGTWICISCRPYRNAAHFHDNVDDEKSLLIFMQGRLGSYMNPELLDRLVALRAG